MNESTRRGPESPTPGSGAGAPPETVDSRLLGRLRAADPAASATPDLAALRAAVQTRIATEAAEPGPVVTEEDVEVVDQHGRAVPTDELAARRRRTGWPLRVAAVAAGALVVGGGGGYAIGAAGGGSPAEPAIAVANPFGAGQESAAAGDMALEDMGRGGGADMAASWPGYFGRTVFTGSGLSADGGQERAWAFDPADAFDAETVAALAAALGVDGEPRQDEWFWSVGPTDGTGATVQVYGDGTASFSFYDPAKDPWFCPSPGVAEDRAEGDVEREEPMIEPLPGEPCGERDLGPAPQGGAAEAQLRDVLAAVGEDPAGYELVAESPGDALWSYVIAYQVVDGQRTGLTWGASFTGAGLQSVSGSLADLVDLGEYGVVSPQVAVERLGDPRFGAGGGPVAFREGSVTMDEPVSSVPSGLPQPPAAGSTVPWPVAEVSIVEARLGTALHTQPDGAALLLPTYELTGGDGSVWSVLALADEHLDMASGR